MKILFVCAIAMSLAACGGGQGSGPANSSRSGQSADLPAASNARPPFKVIVDHEGTIDITSLVTDLGIDDIVINKGSCHLLGQKADGYKGMDVNEIEALIDAMGGIKAVKAKLPPFKMEIGEERRLTSLCDNKVVVIDFKTNRGSFTWNAN